MSVKVQCPSCGEQAEKTGKKITCQSCDSIFTVTKTGSASVEQIGWKEELENRVKANEDRLAGLIETDPDADADSDDAAVQARLDAEQDGIEDEAEEPILPE